MNINDFVILPGSKTGTSVRLKAKTVRELQLEKEQLETENKEMEKKLRQLQSNMSREKEERKKSSAYHWKSGQAGPMTIQARVFSQSKENHNKISSGKVKLQILKEQLQEPMKELFRREMANAGAHGKPKVEETACGLIGMKSTLLRYNPFRTAVNCQSYCPDKYILAKMILAYSMLVERLHHLMEKLQQAEADTCVGKLEAADDFIKEVNPNEPKVNHEQKKVNSKHQVTSDKFSSLPVSVGGAEEQPSESTCAGLENEDKGLLLRGTFNEEESAKSFQEALIQWRKGNCDHREELRTNQVLSVESVGICEVQTNLPVKKEPFQIEFKKGGLSYMEKLLLKKYRRTPVDQISGSCVKDSRPLQTLSVLEAVTGEGAEDDDDVDDLTVEEVKRYWTSVFREEVADTISENAESSLKIEFLHESYGKHLEESSDLLVMEAWGVGMNEQGKAEAPKQCGRNPVSSKEVSQEKMVVCSHLERNTVQKEGIPLKTERRSLSSCKLPEKISNPSELMTDKSLIETKLQKNHKDSQKPDSVSNSQSLVLPGITKSSVLQDVAKRQKSVSTQYLGLEGFFIVGANPKQVIPEARSSRSADSGPMDSTIPFSVSGDRKWVPERSLSEYADGSVVQDVLESQLNQPSCGLETQNSISPLMEAWRSYPGNYSRPWSTNTLHCKLTANCPTDTQPRPRSSPLHAFRADMEIPKHKCLDVTRHAEYLWECAAEQEALLALEKELQTYTAHEKHYSLTSEDVTSASRHPEKTGRNTTDFHKNLELKDHSRLGALRGWDESQMEDEEEVLEDKQQVLALQ